MIKIKLEIEKINNIEDNKIDLIQVICKIFLDKIASGKKLDYFERKAGEILNKIYEIKKDRIFR